MKIIILLLIFLKNSEICSMEAQLQSPITDQHSTSITIYDSSSNNSSSTSSRLAEIHIESPNSPPSTSSSFHSHSSSFGTSEGSLSVEIQFTSHIIPQGSPFFSDSERQNISSNCGEENERHMAVGNGEYVRSSEDVIEKLIDHVTSRWIGWKEVEARFDQLVSYVGPDLVPSVNESDFAFCIGMNETPEFAEELLRSLRGRSDKGHQITKCELQDYWHHINNPRFSSRLQIFLNMCKMNGYGEITEKEMKQAILLSAAANMLSISNQEAGEYARLVLEEVCNPSNGYLQVPDTDQVIYRPQETRSSAKMSRCDPPSSIEVFLHANWRRIWIIMLWLIACLSLFTWKFIQYRHRSAFYIMGYCLCTAKGAAETLKFNMALILLPVCRNVITWLRKFQWISSSVPFNDNINFHKMIAGGIVIGVILHGGTHLACDFPRIAGADNYLFRQTIAADFKHRQPSYAEILATTEGATGFGMVILMAIAFMLATRRPRRDPSSLPRFVRRFTGFNTFWYSHHLFVLVYVLLILHSMFLFLTSDIMQKTTWMYLAIPVLIYLGERITRAIRAKFYEVKVIKAKTYPGKVLSVKLQKPAGFRYQSGMYIFVQCPQISAFEWHPFSLTSAPDEDHLSLHIRTLGDWSYQLYTMFQEAIVSGSFDFPKISIDGPYGASTQDHVKYDINLFIGLGIGATPFISVLKDIIHGEQGDGGDEGIRKRTFKAYFYWVTREQSSFDWFRDIMKEISSTNQKEIVVEMHNYLTSIYRKGDTRSTLISAIQALHYMKTGVDIISRTPVQTHFARPNWFRVFSRISNRHQGEKIGVFYCGPQELARELQKLCNKMSSTSSTRFVFHKENN